MDSRRVFIYLLLTVPFVSKWVCSNTEPESARTTNLVPCTDCATATDSWPGTNTEYPHPPLPPSIDDNDTWNGYPPPTPTPGIDNNESMTDYPPPDDYGYMYMDLEPVILNSTDVEKYLERSDFLEYLNSYSNNFQRMLIKETLRHCPFLKLCHFTFNLYSGPFLESCCQPCQCNEDCVLYKDCCPDYRSIDLDIPDGFMDSPSTGVEVTCMDTELIYPANSWAKTYSPIKAVQSCPLDTAEDLYFRCTGEFQSFPDIAFNDIMPLSDSNTSITYRNEHCAICNGVDLHTLTPWTPKLNCVVAPVFSTANQLISTILNGEMHCSIQLQAPKVVSTEFCETVISTCNVTGLWAEFDPSIFRACESYQSVIHINISATLYQFRNPFCAICNGIIPASDYLCKPKNLEPSAPFSLSGLLRLDSLNEQETTRQHNCNSNSMFDDFTKRCKMVTCPYHRIFIEDRCDLFLETSDNLQYEVTCLLKPSTDIVIKELYGLMPQIRSVFYNLLYSLLDGYICSDQIMILAKNGEHGDELIVEDIQYHFYVTENYEHSIDVVVNQLLSLDDMNVMLNNSAGDTILFELHLKDENRFYNNQIPYDNYHDWTLNGDIPVELEDLLAMSYEQDGKIIVPYFYWNESPGFCYTIGKTNRILTMRPCPMYSVSTSELGLHETLYGFKHNTESDINLGLSDFVKDETNQSDIRMCVDTYRRLLMAFTKKDDNSVYSAELIVSIISVSISIVCLIISLITYCCIPQLQTLPGKNNMALITSLLLAQCFYLVGSYGNLDTDSFGCKFVGGLTHFFWLLSLFWMNVCTFHMFRVLLQTKNVSSSPSSKKHIKYHIYAMFMSSVFVAINIIVTMVTSDNSDVGYGNTSCYISTQRMVEVTLGIPAAVVVLANMSMFIAIVIKLKRAPTVSKNVKHERNYFLVFIKLSTITGATWLFGFVYMWTSITVFSYFFIILTGSQGLFLMVAFVCNSRTFGMVKNRSKAFKASSSGHTHSARTLTTSNGSRKE